MLLTSLTLAACESNTTKNDNLNRNNNIEKNDNISQATPDTERLSYQEYLERYGSILNIPSENSDFNFTDDTQMNMENIKKNEDSDEEMLATFSTPLQASSDERVNNIEIVCDRLNNYILKPNETFSYNDVTGPFGPSDGFEEAPILLQDGSKTEGYGGGVCQLSSTLYNVVKNIPNVEITERHHHSSPVSYVKDGEDATVSLQSGLDFKFVNHNNYPIQFKASCENEQVYVWAYKVI